MAKLLNTTFLVTQSAPATPSSGFGTLFASSSKIFFKNSLGTTYDLTTAGGGSGGYINVLTYTSSANYTTSSGVQYIKVICAGAGGGGGSGRINPLGTRFGGGGGAGGNINIAYFSSQSLTGNTYSVRVGGGGNGGGPRASSSGLLNGVTGGTGISSSFSIGSTVLLWGGGGIGGGGGGGAANGGTNTAPSTANTPNPFPPFYYSGVNGGNSNASFIPIAAGNSLSGTRTLAGGGAGGGLGTLTFSGGSGSAIYSYNILVQSGSPSPSSSGLPGNNGAPVIDVASLLFYSGSNITTGIRIGTGGHGGGGGGITAVGPSGGNGGSGSLGAGGGGGGAATTASVGNPIFNGAGGPGGNGFVLIFEYF